MTLLEQTEVPALEGPAWTHRATPPDPLSFASLLMVLRRRYRLFIAVFVATLAASLAAALLLPPQYTAEATLMIDPRPHASLVATDGNSFAAPDATLVDTEVQVMTSPAVLDAVSDRLRLARDPEFAARDSRVENVTPSARDTVIKDMVEDNLAKHLSVNRQGLTYIVAIRARSNDADKAAAIANTMANEYLRQSMAQRSRLAADQARTLTTELGPLGQQVIAADQAVADFRAAHGIVTGGKSGDAGTVTDQQIQTIAAEVSRATADAAAATATAAAARAQIRNAGVDSVSQVLNSSSLTELRNQRAQVLREQAQIATVYSPTHPASIRINKQLATLDDEIKTAANRVVQGLESDARAADARAATLRGQLAALAARQSQDARSMVVADGLQRNADAKRSTFNDLSRNAQQQAQEARIGDVRAWQVAVASPPIEPSFPKKSIFLMIGAILGAGLGAGAVVGAELREKGFRSASEVELELRLPVLAATPEVDAPGRRRLGGRRRKGAPWAWDYVVAKPASSYVETIRNVRATLLAPDAETPKATSVCVTSALVDEGKSVTAVALARVMAMSGDRVLLIDCDLRRGGLTPLRQETAAPEPSGGLVEVLDGDLDLDKATMKDVAPGLSLLGLNAPVFMSRDIFSGRPAREMMARLKTEYDFIIMDAPPVLAVTDAWLISSICDATLMVVRHSKTPRAAVQAAVDRLRRRGVRLHGVVLNRRPRGRGGMEDDYASLYRGYVD